MAIHKSCPSVWFTCFFCLIPLVSTATPYAAPSVGVIQGTEHSTSDGLPYYAFRGIPYAEPPTGSLRWQLPVAFPDFEPGHVFQATDFQASCPQKPVARLSPYDEDCLYLDVYVPHNVTALYDDVSEALAAMNGSGGGSASSPASGVPLMIWIHGGAYHEGGGRKFEGGKLASQQGIIVVVVQYRLGALGFLSTGGVTLPGNYGLWDQRLGMKWVKDNIRAFGGDVSKVTVAGESAGSTSVNQHTISDKSSGLFQRAVMMSGTVEASWCFNPDPRATFDQFTSDAGCGDGTLPAQDRLRCLMTLSADVIYNTSVITEAGNFVTFVPNVDGDFFQDSAEKLLADEDYLRSIGFFDYQMLLGVLNNEGVVTYELLAAMAPSVVSTGRLPYAVIDAALLDTVLAGEYGPDGYGLDMKDVLNYQYFFPRDPGQLTFPVQQAFDLFTHISFLVPAMEFLKERLSFTSGATSSSSSSNTHVPSSASGQLTVPSSAYLYYFDWVPSLTAGTKFAGMPHGLDVDYLFGLTNYSLTLYGTIPLGGTIEAEEMNVSRMYGDMIGAFVRTGNPNEGIPHELQGQWLPYDTTNQTFLRFAKSPAVDRGLFGHAVSLWTDLLPRLRSRWLQETAGTTTSTPIGSGSGSGSESMTYFHLSESGTNTLLISLIVVAAVLLLIMGVLLQAFVRFYRRSNINKYRTGEVPDISKSV